MKNTVKYILWVLFSWFFFLILVIRNLSVEQVFIYTVNKNRLFFHSFIQSFIHNVDNFSHTTIGMNLSARISSYLE